jgi:predicted AAA+ superfamily ATPase
MVAREAEKELRALAAQFKAVAVTGPRQSGKTTLVRHVFSELPYVSMENPDTRNFAVEDPRGFLGNYKDGAIFDEVQKVPHLFSYLQQVLDEESRPGRYILTGSNNFLLMDSISQSLAGRIGYLILLPFSINEIKILQPHSTNDLIIKGSYPPVFDQPVEPHRWLANYINTYLERDVRQTIKISNQLVFDRFINHCGR